MKASKFTIIQITASYKPAYVYGGPTMSVAKLCEAILDKGTKSNEEYLQTNDQHLNKPTSNARFKLEVFTTTANGKSELNVKPNEKQIVDGVLVTYFKRITKDHTHFSPTLLWDLRKEIKDSLKLKHQRLKVKEQSSTNNEQRTTNNELIIHIHAWWNLVSIFSCFIAKWYNVPVILSPRGMLTQYSQQNRNGLAKKIIHQMLGKTLLSYCHIHATSEQEKQDILQIIKPKSITVIPNLVELRDASVFRLSSIDIEAKNEQRATNNEQQPFKLIFLSRIEQKKGLELLLDALSTLSFNWELTIAGTGNDEYIESLKTKAKSLKLDDKINWIGQVKNEDKFELLAEHDLTVLTSHNENFANVVIESLSVGTAVLVSSKVGLSDYVILNELGLVCELNQQSITDQLNKAFNNPNELVRIRNTAPNLIINDFNDNALINRYINLYETVLNA